MADDDEIGGTKSNRTPARTTASAIALTEEDSTSPPLDGVDTEKRAVVAEEEGKGEEVVAIVVAMGEMPDGVSSLVAGEDESVSSGVDCG